MDTNSRNSKPELWGGMECTINRLDGGYRDQLLENKHYSRTDDLARICSLGISKLRFPILWEALQADERSPIYWKSVADDLSILRAHDVEPIAGLLHHGSGPRFTSLADDKFATKFASYAGKVALEFPSLQLYTPINEPLTTARFSGLYGFWYPHAQTPHAFLKMLVNQVKGIVLAMREIRKVNPLAELIQTEDLGKTHSTSILKYQADFENERRWLSYDLLFGRVTRHHPLWSYMVSHGISEKELDFFQENPCIPSIMGFNYYVTSERFLDENIPKYPDLAPGTNGLHEYIDTEAVRTDKMQGVNTLLKEAWGRYGHTLALTETHLSCTREQQMRWLDQTWQNAIQLNREGIRVRAVTAWALTGSVDWDSLLTQKNGHYEGGAYIVNGNKLDPTLMVSMLQALGKRQPFRHPILDGRGWWEQEEPVAFEGKRTIERDKHRPLLILGATGTLGSAFTRICTERHIAFVALSHSQLDICDTLAVSRALQKYDPWCLVNATGYVNVDLAEEEADKCYAINTAAPANMASLAHRYGIHFVNFSSDLVFNGAKHSPYLETDDRSPLNVYGNSKAEGERLVLQQCPGSLIIRTSAFFGPWDKYNFVTNVLNAVRNDSTFHAADDITVSPTYVPDLVHASIDLLIDGASGIWHVSNKGATTWANLAECIASRDCRSNKKLIIKQPGRIMDWKAVRPIYSVLDTGKGVQLPKWENAVERFFHQIKA